MRRHRGWNWGNFVAAKNGILSWQVRGGSNSRWCECRGDNLTVNELAEVQNSTDLGLFGKNYLRMPLSGVVHASYRLSPQVGPSPPCCSPSWQRILRNLSHSSGPRMLPTSGISAVVREVLDTRQVVHLCALHQPVLHTAKKIHSTNNRGWVMGGILSGELHSEKFHGLDRSNSRVLFVRHLLMQMSHSRRQSVPFTTFGWMCGSPQNTMGVQGLSQSDCSGECLDSLQIHSCEGDV